MVICVVFCEVPLNWIITILIILGIPDYWEEAVAHADEAHQQEILGNYEVAFAMYKTAIVCLLSGVQGNNGNK